MKTVRCYLYVIQCYFNLDVLLSQFHSNMTLQKLTNSSEKHRFEIKIVSCYLFFLGNVLDSCDGRVISNNNIYVDFGVIKYKCSCSFNFTFNPQLFYLASINPGFDDCGTAIQIKEMNNNIFSIQCMSSVPPTVSSSQFTTVELTCDYPRDYNYCKYTGYCLRVFSNGRYCLLFKCYLK